MAGTVPVAKSLKDIYTEDAIPIQTTRWEKLLSSFKTAYGAPADFVSRSPGRVNIIGEHIDYSLYGVLPMAITADALLAIRVVSDSPAKEGHYKISIRNILPKFSAQEFELPYETVDIDASVHEWTNYFKSGLSGALELLRKTEGFDDKPRSLEILMDGTVPAGGGLSSSAAFVSASALAVMYANGVHNVDKTALTELAIVSERAVGVNSGGMDQAASVMSLRGSALYVNFVPSLTAKAITFPSTNPELTFLIAQSFVQSDKHVTGPVCYNLRVVECTLAAAYLNAICNPPGTNLPRDDGPLDISLNGFHATYFKETTLHFKDQLKALIELTKKTLPETKGYTREEIAEVLSTTVSDLDARFTSTFPVRAERFLLRQRALHVYSEALRVLDFLSILENPLPDSFSDTKGFNESLGKLMNETQESCRTDYDCSCPEIDELCAIAVREGAYGSRLTGAGWGGCTVHLVPADRVDAVRDAWEKEYYSKRSLTSEEKASAVVVSRPGGGSAIFKVVEGKEII